LEDVPEPYLIRRHVSSTLSLLSRVVGVEKVSLILVFGSVLDGCLTSVSDVDTLIVLRNVKPADVRRAAQALKSLEPSRKGGTILDAILRSVEGRTGMFQSFFVCSEESFLSGDFASIFSLSKAMSLLLAPSKLVLGSVLDGAKVVYGSLPLPFPPHPRPTPIQLIKSLLMNLLLSLSALLISPLTGEAAKYALEAGKWSIMASYYYNYSRRISIKKLPEALKGRLRSYAQKLLRRREKYYNDPVILALTPIFSIMVHVLALKRGLLKSH